MTVPGAEEYQRLRAARTAPEPEGIVSREVAWRPWMECSMLERLEEAVAPRQRPGTRENGESWQPALALPPQGAVGAARPGQTQHHDDGEAGAMKADPGAAQRDVTLLRDQPSSFGQGRGFKRKGERNGEKTDNVKKGEGKWTCRGKRHKRERA